VAVDGLQLARSAGRGLKTAVRILRGRLKGREGWIAGTIEDRAARGVTKALVHIEGEMPELYATSSIQNAKRTAAGPKARGDPDQLVLIT